MEQGKTSTQKNKNMAITFLFSVFPVWTVSPRRQRTVCAPSTPAETATDSRRHHQRCSSYKTWISIKSTMNNEARPFRWKKALKVSLYSNQIKNMLIFMNILWRGNWMEFLHLTTKLWRPAYFIFPSFLQVSRVFKLKGPQIHMWLTGLRYDCCHL